MKVETARGLVVAAMLASGSGCAPAAPATASPPRATDVAVAPSAPAANEAAAPTRLAHAESHTCVVTRDGALYCWGENGAGQVGVAGPAILLAATRVPSLPAIVEVAVDELSTCAVGKDGGLYCFGFTWTGRGDGSALRTPTRVPGFEDVVSVAIGIEHRCALLASGEIACFGGDRALLGGRTDETPERAAIVAGLPPMKSVVASNRATCGLDATGAAWCFGEVACGAAPAAPEKPYRVQGIEGATRLSLSEGSLCAITAGGDARCLPCAGDGDRAEATFPEIRGARAISADARRGCVVERSGRAACWGSLRRDTWGNEAWVAGAKPVLTPRAELGRLIEIAVTPSSACALGDDDLVRCWGLNRLGELGGGSVPWSATPTERGLGKGEYAAIAAAGNATCGLVLDGTVECFGEIAPEHLAMVRELREASNVYGAGLAICVDVGENEPRCLPVEPGFDPVPPPKIGIALQPVPHLMVEEGTCVLFTGGARCAARTTPSPLFDDLARLEASQIAFGREHACAVLQNGTVRCGGDNTYGQLGRAGAASTRTAPVAGLRKVRRIAVGETQSCAVVAGGDLFCWGIDARIGERVGVDGRKPVRVLSDVFDFFAGGRHFCAQQNDGAVRCWGSDVHGQLGDSPELAYQVEPRRVAFPTRPHQIVGGREHSCALLDGGIVRCWGNNDFGQLGDGVARRHNDRAFVVAGLPPAR